MTNWLSPACSASASFASRACSASSTPRRRALRRAPTSTVANRAASIVWPIASVIDTCSVSRSSEKSKVSPPISPAGSQPGGKRELPGLAGEGARQQPTLDLGRQRQAEPSAVPTRRDRCSGGWRSPRTRRNVRPAPHPPPSAHPGVAPAPTPARRPPHRGWSPARTSERRDPPRSPRPPGRPAPAPAASQPVALAPQSPSPATAVAPSPPEWPRRISDCPLKSAIRKLTSRAPIASASAPASTSTAATGGAASTSASNEFKFSGDRRSSPIRPLT